MLKLLLYVALFIVIVLFVLAIIVIVKPYTIRHDTLTLFTGSLGCGKSFWTVQQAVVQLRKNRFNIFLKNINPIRRLIYKKPKIPRPIMLSTIPIRISLREMSSPLGIKQIVLQQRVPEGAVVVIDEFNLMLSQMDYKIESEELVNEFFTLYRHQTGGHIFINTQCIDKCHWIARYVVNRAYNLREFRKPIFGLPILAWVKVRNISIGDEIKTVENADDEKDGWRNLFSFFPIFRRYETRCYRDRYKGLPPYEFRQYAKLKRNSFVKIDKKAKFEKLIDEIDDFNCGGAGSEQLNRPTTEKQEISCKSWKDRKK